MLAELMDRPRLIFARQRFVMTYHERPGMVFGRGEGSLPRSSGSSMSYPSWSAQPIAVSSGLCSHHGQRSQRGHCSRATRRLLDQRHLEANQIVVGGSKRSGRKHSVAERYREPRSYTLLDQGNLPLPTYARHGVSSRLGEWWLTALRLCGILRHLLTTSQYT
jgi:hypothetical protein